MVSPDASIGAGLKLNNNKIKNIEGKSEATDGIAIREINLIAKQSILQKGDIPAAPSGTATLLRLSPSHWYYPSSLLLETFRYSQLPWLDGRCVQGPGTYSPDRS